MTVLYERYTRCMWLPEKTKIGDVIEYKGDYYKVIDYKAAFRGKGREKQAYFDVLGIVDLEGILLGEE